ncbi:MAG: 4Fe-4S binding protein [Thermodesulfobacteriota bacterium]
MQETVYGRLCETLARRRGRYPGMDIPEFYALVEELFSPDEAAVYNAIPKGFHPAETMAKELGKPVPETARILEGMADKGLCTAGSFGGVTYYGAPTFVPGIFEFQFMRGTHTERDRKIARLIRDYKAAVDAAQGPVTITYPTTRVIPVDEKIDADSTVHTYHQVASYIENIHPLSVSTCFCRHEAKLVDERDDCGNPYEVCMQFGMGAQFVIDRKLGRQITKEEAFSILKKSEEAGLVHASINRQDIDFLCNCCACHSMILKTALAHPKPGVILNSGFQPRHGSDLCTACGVCIERCPTDALAMNDAETWMLDTDRCIGCGVCATGCDFHAITLVERAGVPPPPADQKALLAAVKAGGA